MARTRRRRSSLSSAFGLNEWLRLFRLVSGFRISRELFPAIVVGVIVLVVIAYFNAPGRKWFGGRDLGPIPEPSRDGFLLCTWNLENLFDDNNDPKDNDELENWYGTRPEMLDRKLDTIVEALLAQNGGRGPDILAVVEVESRRAVELLQQRLNAKISEDLAYRNLVHHDNRTGRRIEPALLTRLPVRSERTRIFGIRRMIEAHIDVKGRELVVLVSHWTSKVTDEEGGKRVEYAKANYQAFLQQYQNDPNVDMVLCGDFNDAPDEVSIRTGLHAVSSPRDMTSGGGQPTLLNLMDGKDPRVYGTYFYHSKWQILDHIVISPGLLNPEGWQVVLDTVRSETPLTGAIPKAFGGPRAKGVRGASDHRAVTVRIKVDSLKPEIAKSSESSKPGLPANSESEEEAVEER